MKKKSTLIILIAAALFLPACRLLSPTATPTASISIPTATLAQSLPVVETTEPAAVLPTTTKIPQPTKTSTPFIPIKGTISVQNFKLRAGPGFLFDTVGLYDENDTVQVLGRSLGSGWLYVATSDSRAGWMKAEYIDLAGELDQVPYFGFKDANMIYGHVRDGSGKPLSKIGIVIFPATSQDTTREDTAVTDETGTYYLFLPLDLQGDYTIGVNAYSCDSNAVNSECALQYGYPSAQSIPLPHPSDISIEFVLPPLPTGG